tara:strand:- start:165 stop:383 length:219 start_codon:yes stop_codon:yes gene_type:complete
MKMDKIAKADYNKVLKQQQEETIDQYVKQTKLMYLDMETILKQLNEAESIVRLIADTYHLPEAEGYFNDTSK